MKKPDKWKKYSCPELLSYVLYMIVVKNVLLLLVVSSVSWFILSGTVIEETTT